MRQYDNWEGHHGQWTAILANGKDIMATGKVIMANEKGIKAKRKRIMANGEVYMIANVKVWRLGTVSLLV